MEQDTNTTEKRVLTEAELRTKELAKIDKCLAELKIKSQELHALYQKDDIQRPEYITQRYLRAYTSARTIHARLETKVNAYRREPHNLANLKSLKSASKNILDTSSEDMKNLAEHRGYKELFYNLAIGIATFGLAHFINSCRNEKFTFFSCNTGSINKIHAFESAIDEAIAACPKKP